jgi:endogenous inhibitor of DNA gyrase (YacG/DUF329 family)
MPVTLVCDTCGDEYEVNPYRADDSRFCSNDCRANWQSDAYEGDGAPNYSGGKETYECPVCGETIEEWESQVDDRKFCSKSCYTGWQKYYEPISVSYTEEGYPVFNTSEGVVRLQRLLATLKVDDISDLKGMDIHHSQHRVWPGRKDAVNLGVTYLDNLEVLSKEDHGKVTREES